MSISGRIQFYAEDKPDDQARCIREIGNLLGAKEAFTANVFTVPGSSLDFSARHEDDYDYDASTQKVETKEIDCLAEIVVEENQCLYIDVAAREFGKKAWEETKKVPEELRDTFAPGSVSICSGRHDIFEMMENEEGTLFASTCFSVSIYGYGAPHDWARYREEIAKHPFIVALKEDLERILGEVGMCVYWD